MGDTTSKLITLDQLKLTAQRIKTMLNGKQAKLTAGENITISAANVISAQTNLKFDASFTVQVDTGAYKKGDVIPVGTPVLTVIKQMLSEPPAPTTVTLYYGGKDNIPTGITGLNELKNQSVSTLTTTGVIQNIVTGNVTTEEGQYPTIACPKSLSLSNWVVVGAEGIPLPFVTVESGDYNIYYQNVRTYDEPEGTNYKFTFTTGDAT